MKTKTSIIAILLLLFSAASAADVVTPAQLKAFLSSEVKALMSNEAVLSAIVEQNIKTAGLSHDEIDALDNQWKTEVKQGIGNLVSGVVDSDVSDLLREFMEANRKLYEEIFVMDARGLNVAAAEPTSDYWQGDEDKWRKTFSVGPDAVFADDVKFDESSGERQAQISLTIKDPKSGKAIGAITFGVDVNAL